MRKRHKGYALIYVMCTILLLTALVSSILTLVTSNRMSTAYMDKSNRAKLAAEAGIEAAVTDFKKRIASNFDLYLEDENNLEGDSNISNPFQNILNGDLTVTNSAQNYTYTFQETTNYLDGTNQPIKNKYLETNIHCLAIKSTGNYGGLTKTITAYVDEQNIANIYFDNMFTDPITLTSDLNILPPKINTNNIATTWNDYSKMNIVQLGNSSNSNTPDLITYKVSTNGNSNINLENLTSSFYEYATSNEGSLNSIDLSNFDSVMAERIQSYIDSIKRSDGGNSVDDMLKYCGIYKILFVDGNLDVGQMDAPLVNYIIYCTGTVNVDTNSNLQMWNCSIFANNLTYNGTPIKYKVTNNTAQFYNSDGTVMSAQPFQLLGLGSTDAADAILKHVLAYNSDPTIETPYSDLNQYVEDNSNQTRNITSIFPAGAATQFSITDRANSDTIFNDYLDGYAYGLKLRYVDIVEN